MHRRNAEGAERRREKGNCVGHRETVADAPASPHCEPPLAMGGTGRATQDAWSGADVAAGGPK